ncbi:MAG: M23 family metallopeptidase, partial [Gammaproteobacteria bacterium]
MGVDIAAPEGTPVYAIAEGIVADKLETDISATDFKKDNHCMGRVVIIDHGENFTGKGRYSLYAHLKEISDALPGPGERVKLGGEIGTVGRSGFDESSRVDCRSPAGPHLHLEVKDKPILENPMGGKASKYGSDTGPYWGYTPNYPDDYGYHDPILMLHRTAPLSPAIRVRITAKGASEPGLPIRAGPDVNYRAFQRFSTPGIEFEAIREVTTTSPACSLGWYQVRPIDQGCFLDQPDGSGGFIPEGWICTGNRNEVWIEPSDIAPDTLSPTWTQKFPDSVPTPERSGFDIAFDGARGEGVLFGGSNNNNAILLNDTWIWNGINWIRKLPGSSP